MLCLQTKKVGIEMKKDDLSNHWRSLSVNYAAPRAISGVQLFDTVDALWAGNEDCSGTIVNHGFLFLYELFTGTVKAKLGGEPVNVTLAILLTQLLADKNEIALMPSVVCTLSVY